MALFFLPLLNPLQKWTWLQRTYLDVASTTHGIFHGI